MKLERARKTESMSRCTLLSLLLIACVDDPTGPDGLRATVEVQPVEFRAGEWISVDVAVANQRSRAVLIEEPWPCRSLFQVTAPDGKIVQHSERMCLAIYSPTFARIEPGERIVYSQAWNGGVNDGIVLGGRYLVKASVRVLREGILLSEPVSVRIVRPTAESP